MYIHTHTIHTFNRLHRLQVGPQLGPACLLFYSHIARVITPIGGGIVGKGQLREPEVLPSFPSFLPSYILSSDQGPPALSFFRNISSHEKNSLFFLKKPLRNFFFLET
ncbi:hypothetical protein TWF730_006788 [Orbilia blumenaviensis]|uniref:Uncharacterized protein n=1 Tax=Orbilia blumenaviensis TaxID=1796055 RepID=A0AAV9VIR5_9PEZI